MLLIYNLNLVKVRFYAWFPQIVATHIPQTYITDAFIKILLTLEGLTVSVPTIICVIKLNIKLITCKILSAI